MQFWGKGDIKFHLKNFLLLLFALLVMKLPENEAEHYFLKKEKPFILPHHLKVRQNNSLIFGQKNKCRNPLIFNYWLHPKTPNWIY